jgi:hypothetical protein
LARAVSEFDSEVKRLLAEQGMSLRRAARLAHYDVAYLSRVVNGRQPGSSKLAAVLDEVLGADGALAVIADAGLNPDDDGRLGWVVRNPRRIDIAAVTSLAAVLTAQRRAEDALGSAAVLPAVSAQLRAVSRLVTEALGPVRPAVVDVGAQWAQFAGWLARRCGRWLRADQRGLAAAACQSAPEPSGLAWTGGP